MTRWQVHVFTRGEKTGLSEWQAIRPTGSERPYVFATYEEAQRWAANAAGGVFDPTKAKPVEV